MIRHQVDKYHVSLELATKTVQGMFRPPGEQSFTDENAAKDFTEKMPRLQMFAEEIEKELIVQETTNQVVDESFRAMLEDNEHLENLIDAAQLKKGIFNKEDHIDFSKFATLMCTDHLAINYSNLSVLNVFDKYLEGQEPWQFDEYVIESEEQPIGQGVIEDYFADVQEGDLEQLDGANWKDEVDMYEDSEESGLED
jgi:hypothetical protein